MVDPLWVCVVGGFLSALIVRAFIRAMDAIGRLDLLCRNMAAEQCRQREQLAAMGEAQHRQIRLQKEIAEATSRNFM